MRTRFAFGENGHNGIVVVAVAGIGSESLFAVDSSPTIAQNLLTGGFEGDAIDVGENSGGRELAVGVESGDKAFGYHIIDQLLVARESSFLRLHIGGNNGVVVGDFRVVEHFFRLRNLVCQNRSCECSIRRKSFQHSRNGGVDVLAKICGVDTRVGGDLFLVERLNEFQRFVGRERKFLVALHLQGSEVEKTRWRFLALLRRGRNDGERRRLYLFDYFKSIGFYFVAALGAIECSVAVESFNFPKIFGDEVFDFAVTSHNERQSGCLHTTNGKHIAVLGIFFGVKTRSIHAQNPVAYSA